MITAQANRILLMVEEFNGCDFSGRFFTPLAEREIPFSSYAELLLLLEEQFDRLDFPQGAEKRRSFVSGRTPSDHAAADHLSLYDHSAENGRKGCMAKFMIHVLFRHHSSWQGRIRSIDKKRELDFRSALELLHIICGVLNERKETNPCEK